MERLNYNQHDYVSDSGDVLPYSQYDTTYQASFTPAPVETAPWHNADTPAHTGEGATKQLDTYAPGELSAVAMALQQQLRASQGKYQALYRHGWQYKAARAEQQFTHQALAHIWVAYIKGMITEDEATHLRQQFGQHEQAATPEAPGRRLAHQIGGAAVRTMHTSETPYTDAQLLAAHDDTWR